MALIAHMEACASDVKTAANFTSFSRVTSLLSQRWEQAQHDVSIQSRITVFSFCRIMIDISRVTGANVFLRRAHRDSCFKPLVTE